MDLDARQVLLEASAPIGLTPLETELLRRLVRSDDLVSRRDLLTDVWEYAPEVETRAVDNTVRRLRKKIEEDPKAPKHLISAYGGGYRLVLSHAASGAVTPSETTNIVLDPSTYFGRDSAMESVQSGFRGASVVTLLGPAGIGKTRLARRFAANAIAQDRVPQAWFVDLTKSLTEADVVAAVARAIGAPLGGDAESLARFLAARGPLLLVLDNFEHVVDAAPATVGAWAPAIPSLQILATSRETLRVPGETVIALETLSVDDAAALFLDRAHTSGRVPALAQDRISPADQAAVRELARRLDGLPLALELAAARAGLVGPARMVEMLNRRFDLLSGGPRGATSRRATLRGAIDWSWTMLEPWEQAAFAQLSVFRGAFTVESAQAVLLVADAPWALDVLAALRDKSMIRPHRDGGFVMLESLRDYGGEQLGSDTKATRARHAAYVQQVGEVLVETLPSTPKGVGGGLEQLAADATAAHKFTLTHGKSEDAVRLAMVLDPVLSRRDPRGRARLWSATCDATRGAAPATRARALQLRAETARVAGDHASAEADCIKALKLAEETGDPKLKAQVLGTWGASALSLGLWAEAEDRLGQARTLTQEHGDARAECYLLANLGTLAWMQARLDEAESGYRELLVAARQARLPRMEGVALGHLGNLELQRGRLVESAAHFEEALAVLTSLGDRSATAVARGNLGVVLLEQGRRAEAEQLLRQAEAEQRRLLATTDVGVCLGNLAILTFLNGDAREALALLRQAHDIAGDDDRLRAYLQCHRAQVRCALDSLDAAREDLCAAVTTLSALGDEDGGLLVEVARGAFDLAEARGADRDGDSAAAAAARERASERAASIDVPDERGVPSQRSSDLRLASLLLRGAP